MRKAPRQGVANLISLVTLPDSRPASALTSLNVDPGGYVPAIALLLSGRLGSVAIACHSLLLSDILSEKMFASTDGELNITRTSPLRGSRTTTAPFKLSGNASSATF